MWTDNRTDMEGGGMVSLKTKREYRAGCRPRQLRTIQVIWVGDHFSVILAFEEIEIVLDLLSKFHLPSNILGVLV